MSLKKIGSLDIIRAISFLLICLHHSKLKLFASSGYYGVSVFLILSGFLLTYNYYNRQIDNSIKFAISKIKNIYYVHIICMVMMIPFLLFGDSKLNILNVVLSIVSNILLIQEWFPLNVVSINGVSWFVSVLFFSYLLFPYVLKTIKKKFSINKAILFIVLLYVVQIIASIIDHRLESVLFEGILIKNNWSFWFIYEFALVRSIDFLIGCLLGYIFINKEFNNDKDYTIYEIIIILLQIVVMYISAVNKHVSWRYSVIFTPFIVLLIYVFALNNGKISGLYDNGFIKYFSKVSRIGFLIHNVVFRYLSSMTVLLFSRAIEDSYGPFIKILIGIPVTLLLCKIYELIELRLNNR